MWLFNVVGTVDLFYAVLRGLSVGAGKNMGAAWYIPTFIVVALRVMHFIVFGRLLACEVETAVTDDDLMIALAVRDAG